MPFDKSKTAQQLAQVKKRPPPRFVSLLRLLGAPDVFTSLDAHDHHVETSVLSTKLATLKSC